MAFSPVIYYNIIRVRNGINPVVLIFKIQFSDEMNKFFSIKMLDTANF